MKKLKFWLWDRIYTPFNVTFICFGVIELTHIRSGLIIFVFQIDIGYAKRKEKVWIDRNGYIRREHDDPKGIMQARELRGWAQALTPPSTETMEARR